MLDILPTHHSNLHGFHKIDNIFSHNSSIPMATHKKIILGGWRKFAEDAGVNKKEPLENFDWMPSHDEYYYNDCHDALNKVDGAREWLKAYTWDEHDYSESFYCDMATSIGSQMSGGHTNASFIAIMWSYKAALNDWDAWVYETKNRIALADYKEKQVSLYTLREILRWCYNWYKYAANPVSADAAEIALNIQTKCSALGLSGSIPEIQIELESIQGELQLLQALDEQGVHEGFRMRDAMRAE